MRFCTQCESALGKFGNLLCKTCWYAEGELCIHCRSAARQHLNKYRSCKACLLKLFCQQCKAPPPGPSPTCRMCSNLALWCTLHCTATELQSRLCRAHSTAYGAECAYCHSNAEDLSWRACTTDGCPREVHVCGPCATKFEPNGIVCDSCWSASDKLCVACRSSVAQTERRFLRCCRSCFSKCFKSKEDEMVREASQAYRDSILNQQVWNGSEPALPGHTYAAALP